MVVIMFGWVCGFRVKGMGGLYRTSRSFGFQIFPGTVARPYRTHRSSSLVKKVLYPYPGHSGTACTELTEVPVTGAHVLQN